MKKIALYGAVACAMIAIVSTGVCAEDVSASTAPVEQVSLFKQFYRDISALTNMYHAGFIVAFTKRLDYYSYPYLESNNLYNLATVGPSAYLGYGTAVDTLETTLSARLNRRFSVKWTTKTNMPYEVSTTLSNATYLSSYGDSKLYMEYQLTPRNIVFSEVEKSFSRLVFDQTQQGFENESEYWNALAKEKSTLMNRFMLGSKYMPDWGDLTLKLMQIGTDIHMNLPVNANNVATNIFFYNDENLMLFQEGSLEYRVSPVANIEGTGAIIFNKTQDYTAPDARLQKTTLNYPISVKYRPSDKWELQASAENKIESFEYYLYPGVQLMTIEQQQLILNLSNRTVYNKQLIGLSRYFKYEGINLTLNVFREGWYYVFLNTSGSNLNYASIWSSYDQYNTQLGTEFKFSFRPVKDKLFFEGNIKYTQPREKRVSNLTVTETSNLEYKLSAFYKPIQFFELYLERNYPYVRSDEKIRIANGTYVEDTVMSSVESVIANSLLTLYDYNRVGMRYRNFKGTFDIYVQQNDFVSMYFNREGIWNSARLTQPWAFSDVLATNMTYGITYSIQASPKITFEGFYAYLPGYIKSDISGLSITEDSNAYKFLCKYQFSPQMTLEGYVYTGRYYNSYSYLLMAQTNAPSAFADLQSDSREIKIMLTYIP